MDGAKGLIKEGGTGRRAAVIKATEALGGKLESFYFAYGEDDAYLIVDMPDPGPAGPEPRRERLGCRATADDPAHHV